MNYHFYENRIIYILITALVLIQFGSYYALNANNQNMVHSTVRDELVTSKNVFDRLMELRNRQLQQATQILVSDYGFRESIATQDRPTIESMMMNHGKRVEATLLILTNTNDDSVLATVPTSINPAALKASNALISSDLSESSAVTPKVNIAAINLKGSDAQNNEPLNATLFQMVNAPVLTPLPVANLTIGYPINDSFAKDLQRVTNTSFLFFTRHGKTWKLEASPFSANLAAGLVKEFTLAQNSKEDTFKELDIEGRTYLTTPMILNVSADQEVMVIAAKPVNSMIATFKKIERVFVYLLIATLLLSIIAIYFVTRHMIRPLNDLARLDNLTGLGNRRLFNTIVDRAFANLAANNKPFALLFMDLNEFKKINDTLGHDAGDVVLQASANRLKEVMRNSDFIIRLGGDEFAVIVPDSSRKSLQTVVKKIAVAIAAPITHNNTVIKTSVSIGISIAPLDANNKPDLMKRADEAMYFAKTNHVDHFFIGDKKY